MATVLNAFTATAVSDNTTSYATGAFTPVADDLLVVFVASTGNVDTDPTLTASANSLTFTLLTTLARKTTNVDTLYAFVANQLVPASPASMTLTFDCTGDTASGCMIFGAAVTGMSKTGQDAILQEASVSNIATGTAPSTVFGSNALTANATLFAVMATVAGGTTPPTNWTERVDVNHSAPVACGGYSSRDSGFTGTTITLGSTANGSSCAIGLELDTSAGNATVTASVVAGTVTLPASTASANAGVVGSVITGVTALAAATVSAGTGATVTASAIDGTVSIPASTTSAAGTVEASAINGTVSVPAPTTSAGTGATVVASTVNGTVSIPAPTTSVSFTVEPSAVNGTVSIAAPTVSAQGTVVASTVNSTVSTPTTTTSAGATVTASVIAGAVSIPAPTVSAGGSVIATPDVIAGAVSIPAVTIIAGQSATVTASVITGTVSMPAATVSAQATVVAVTISRAVSTPAATVSAQATVAALVITGTVSIPAVTVSANATVAASVITSTVSTPAPTVTAGQGATIVATVISLSASIPMPAVDDAQNSTVNAAVISRTVSIPTPTVVVGPFIFLFQEPFDGIADETPLTTSNTDFTSFTGAGTKIADTAFFVKEGVSARITTTGTDTAIMSGDFTSSDPVFMRFYFRPDAYPTGAEGETNIAEWRTTSSTIRGMMEFSNSGQIRIKDGSTLVDTSTLSLPVDQWSRIEWMVDSNTPTQTCRLFIGANLHGTTPDETLTGAYTRPSGVQVFWLGNVRNPEPLTAWFDEVAIAAAWIGPIQIVVTTPSTISRSVVIPVPVITSGPVVIPVTTISGVVSIPEPTIISDNLSTITPSTISHTVAITSPSITASSINLLFEEGFNGLTDETTITSVNTDFNSVMGVGTKIADTAFSIKGSVSARINTVTAGDLSVLEAYFTSVNPVAARFYFRPDTLPSTGAEGETNIAEFRTTANNVRAGLEFTDNGNIGIKNKDILVGTSTTQLIADEWTRIEWKLDAVTQTQWCRLFVGSNVNGLVPDEEFSATYTQASGTSALWVGQVRKTYPLTAWWDEVAVAQDWIGSAVTSASQTVTPSTISRAVIIPTPVIANVPQTLTPAVIARTVVIGSVTISSGALALPMVIRGSVFITTGILASKFTGWGVHMVIASELIPSVPATVNAQTIIRVVAISPVTPVTSISIISRTVSIPTPSVSIQNSSQLLKFGVTLFGQAFARYKSPTIAANADRYRAVENDTSGLVGGTLRRGSAVIRVYKSGQTGPGTWGTNARPSYFRTGLPVVYSFKWAPTVTQSTAKTQFRAFLDSKSSTSEFAWICTWHEPDDDIANGTLTMAQWMDHNAWCREVIDETAYTNRTDFRFGMITTGVAWNPNTQPLDARGWQTYYNTAVARRGGDDMWDYMGGDRYNPGWDSSERYATISQWILRKQEMYDTVGLPFVIGEGGTARAIQNPNGWTVVQRDQERADWIQSLYNAVIAAGFFDAFCWWRVPDLTSFSNAFSTIMITPTGYNSTPGGPADGTDAQSVVDIHSQYCLASMNNANPQIPWYVP